MTLKMYAIKDRLNGYLVPTSFPNHETAKRYFNTIKQTDQSIMVTPSDFEMYYIGEYDTETGKMENTHHYLVERG